MQCFLFVHKSVRCSAYASAQIAVTAHHTLSHLTLSHLTSLHRTEHYLTASNITAPHYVSHYLPPQPGRILPLPSPTARPYHPLGVTAGMLFAYLPFAFTFPHILYILKM